MSRKEELELKKIERIIGTRIMANLSRDNLDTAIKQAAKVILTWHKQREVELLEDVLKKVIEKGAYWGHTRHYIGKLIDERMVGKK